MINNVYIVFEDNGESFEDYRDWIAKVFINKEQAKKFIKNAKLEEKRIANKTPFYEIHNFWLVEEEIENGVSYE